MKYSQILPEVDHRKDILRYYQKSIIKEEIEDMRLRRGMHWHEVNHLLVISFLERHNQQYR